MVVGVSFSALFGLINIGSTTVFTDVISLVLVGLYDTYLVACGLLLYRRVRGDIGVRKELQDSTIRHTWGPWYMCGGWGIAIDIRQLVN